MRRLVCTPKLVRNGVTSGRRISRSSQMRALMTRRRPRGSRRLRDVVHPPAGGERSAELGTQPVAPRRGGVWIGAPQHDDVVGRRNRDHAGGRLGVSFGVRRVGGPGDEQPVALAAGVDRVVDRAVEVDEVLVHLGAEDVDVEPGVASHERVERPRHPGQAVLGRPRPLVQLHRPPEAGAADAGQDAGDVAVQRRLVEVAAEEAERRADDLVAEVGGGDVAAGVLDRPQQLVADERRDRAPHLVEQRHHAVQLGGVVDCPDVDVGLVHDVTIIDRQCGRRSARRELAATAEPRRQRTPRGTSRPSTAAR